MTAFAPKLTAANQYIGITMFDLDYIHMIELESEIVFNGSQLSGNDGSWTGSASAEATGFDGSSDGTWTWQDIEDFDAREYGSWVGDAFDDLSDILLSDSSIASLVNSLAALENPSDQLVNAAINSAANIAANDPQIMGDMIEWADSFDYHVDQADAWYEANGFEDPYLDWNYGSAGDTWFWQDESPSWWGQEYGIW